MVLLHSLLFAVLVTAAPRRLVEKPQALHTRHILDNGQEFIVKRQAQPGIATPITNRVIPILVGGSSLTFEPNNVIALPGDVLQFQFAQRNHTVTQSAENTPCQPLQATQPAAINSGFIPFDAASGNVGTFNMPVTNSQPMFLYCAQANHCQSGMVMTVNVPNTGQLIAYANLATAATANVPAPQIAGGLPASIPAAQAIFPAAAAASAPAAAVPAPAAPAVPAAPEPAASVPAASAPAAPEAAVPAVASPAPAVPEAAVPAAASAAAAAPEAAVPAVASAAPAASEAPAAQATTPEATVPEASASEATA